jgi:hypothetical protein
VSRGRKEGQPGYGWLNSAIDLDAVPDALPHAFYSKQVFALLGVIPLAMFAYMLITRSIDVSINWEFLLKLYSALYVSQFIVLYPISKKRAYYYHRPQWLLSNRMLLTWPTTVLIPVWLGIAIVPFSVWLTSTVSMLVKLPLIIYLGFVALPFPYYCNQAWLIQARKREWRTRAQCPEMYEGKGTGFWKFCLTQAGLAVVICVILYWLTDAYALMLIKIEDARSIVGG